MHAVAGAVYRTSGSMRKGVNPLAIGSGFCWDDSCRNHVAKTATNGQRAHLALPFNYYSISLFPATGMWLLGDPAKVWEMRLWVKVHEHEDAEYKKN